ncbi:ankyrin [Wilcoxina mikolae CBS 423.85]|nr:ankyrin [Wilcoxina mikolae CBS 423.85]
MVPPIFKLAIELHLLIADCLSICDLNSFLRSNIHLYHTLTPQLYKRLFSDPCAHGAALHWAVKSDRVGGLTHLLDSAPPPPTASLNKLLDTAVDCDNESMVQFLFSRGADTGRSKSITPLLCRAIRNASESMVRLLISYGGNPKPVLHYAASLGKSGMVRTLCEAGMDVNSRNFLSQTPLHCALKYADSVRVLLEFGADLQAKNYLGHTPLFKALRNQNSSLEVVEVLLEAAANAVNPDNNQTPLLLTITDSSMALKLLKYSLNLEVRDHNSFTPFMSVAVKKIPWIVRELVKRGENLEPRDGHGRTPVILTVLALCHDTWNTECCMEVLRILCEEGANVNVRDAMGIPVLNLAVRYWYTGKLKLIRLLVWAGADPKAVHEGKTALDIFQSLYDPLYMDNYDETIQLLRG